MTEQKDQTEKKEAEVEEGAPLCDECGEVMVEEEGEWVCPNCDGEIDFFGEGEAEEDE